MTNNDLKQLILGWLIVRPVLLIVAVFDFLWCAYTGGKHVEGNMIITNKKQQFSKQVDNNDPGSDYK